MFVRFLNDALIIREIKISKIYKVVSYKLNCLYQIDVGDLLHEVLLVDDFSDKPDLGDKLETYIKRFRGKVFLSRNVLRVD